MDCRVNLVHTRRDRFLALDLFAQHSNQVWRFWASWCRDGRRSSCNALLGSRAGNGRGVMPAWKEEESDPCSNRGQSVFQTWTRSCPDSVAPLYLRFCVGHPPRMVYNSMTTVQIPHRQRPLPLHSHRRSQSRPSVARTYHNITPYFSAA